MTGNKYLRLISLLLLVIMLFGALAACGGGSDKPKTTTAEGDTPVTEAETTTEFVPDLPELDLNGEDFTFLIRSRNAKSYGDKYVYTEDMDGEVVNDAIYERNSKVGEKFNTGIAVIEQDDSASHAKKLIQAGDDVFRVLSAQRNGLGSIATEGFLYDWNNVPYVDLEAAWWDPNAKENLSIMNKLYMMPSDISMANFASARFLYFNKEIVENYGLDDPYKLIDANEWVLDRYLGMVKGVSTDLNGDGVMDRNDRFGQLAEHGASNSNAIHFFIGCDIRFYNRDNEGRLVINPIVNEKAETVISKLRAVLYETDYAIDYSKCSEGADTSGFNHIFDYCRSLFAAGHFLFVQNGIGVSEQFKDMEMDYGVAPNPKYDSSQDNYWHATDMYALLFAIPVTSTDLESTGIVMEYMSWLSQKLLLPAYYDITIKSKRVRDDKAGEILDIIKGGMTYDLAKIMGVNFTAVIWDAYTSGNFASTYAAKEEGLKVSIDKLHEKMEAILS